MQKICIAIVLALAMTSVTADFTVTTAGWVKVPVGICNDTETVCTNVSTITLVGLTSSDVNLAAYNAAVPVAAANTSSSTWSVYTKAIITKDLSSTANTTYPFKAAEESSLSYGFAIVAKTENVSGLFNVFLYQTKLVGAAELPRVQVTNNTNVNFTPFTYGLSVSTKTIFIFYSVVANKINATSYAIGTATQGKELTLTSANNDSILIAAGEALSSSQLFTTWKESPTVLKSAIVDFSSGVLSNAADIGGYNNTWACAPYSTDKKYYGVWCQNTVNITTTVYVSSTNTTLTQLFTIANATAQKTGAPIAYGPYLAFFYANPTSTSVAYSYDIWDLEKFNTTKTNTPYITIQPNSTLAQYRIPQGGLYMLAFNNRLNSTVGNTMVQVGLLMGASYLTTVFGFLLTIIAGLFLF